MLALLNYGMDVYNYIFKELADPHMRKYFLMDSPIPVLSIIMLYYYFVFYGGRKFMENRKPFQLKDTMVIYNSIQIVANVYLIIVGLPTLIAYDGSMYCLTVKDNPKYEGTVFAENFRFLMYFYTMLKFSDLTDTIFMVLRKNYHQVTFLHVYHHIGMALGTWLITKFSEGGHESFTGLINSFVHVLMYTYYLMSAKYQGIKSSIWWKKFITQIQLLQFILIFIHHVITITDPDCPVPKGAILLYMTQVALMIYLFSSFYYKSYIAPKQQPQAVNGTKHD